MQIVKMNELKEEQLLQAARILTDGLPLGWPTIEEAITEIEERLVPGNTLLTAMMNQEVIGWGGILAPEYNGNVFELHPLVVRNDKQGEGVGRLLVESLESAAKEQGGLTLYLGADDEKEGGETSLSDVDLYDDLPQKLAAFQAGSHPSAFYLKMGFKVIGVLPDANGEGKPDIFLGKSLM